MRLLIAEDDPTSRAMLAAVLRKVGHDVIETCTGADAWRVLQSAEAPRLAILDRMMPEMDGIDVLRLVRGAGSEPEPYIIMLTARGAKSDIVAGLEAGANDYVSKPFDPGELCARIEVGRRLVEMQDALIASREALAHQAAHDSLTGMLNRRAILERLQQELARADRHGDALAVGIFDIDHFKRINDTFGHQTGDDVLRAAAQVFSRELRPYDAVGRLGGEEFLVITPMKVGTASVPQFDRLRERLADTPLATRSGPVPITVSAGVACADFECTLDGLLGAADAALYQAKALGRNRVVSADLPVPAAVREDRSEPVESTRP